MRRRFCSIIAVFLLCVTLAFGAVFSMGNAAATTPSYNLDDKPFYAQNFEFEVTKCVQSEYVYQIELRYTGDIVGGLPQYETTVYDTLGEFGLQTDDGELLYVSKIAPLEVNAKDKFALEFPMGNEYGHKGFREVNPTKLVIPAETKLGVSQAYREHGGEYTSLVITSEMTLVRTQSELGEDVWTCLETRTYQKFTLDVKRDGIFCGVERDRDGCISVRFETPYVAEERMEFVMDLFPVKWYGIDQVPTAYAVQEKGDATLTVTFLLSQEIVGSMGDVSFSVGEVDEEHTADKVFIVNEEGLVRFYFKNAFTVYGYADKTFTLEKKIEVHITDADEYSIFTFPERQREYVLPSSTATNMGIFFAWKIGEQSYQPNDVLALEAYKETGVHIRAEYIDCKLVDGASLKVGTNTNGATLRFCVKLGEEAFEKYDPNICGMGIIVLPTEWIGEDEFTYHNYHGTYGNMFNAYVLECDFELSAGAYTFYADFSNFYAYDYGKSYSIRAYLLMDFGNGKEYHWDSFILERSVKTVAERALAAKSFAEGSLQESVLQAYVAAAENEA